MEYLDDHDARVAEKLHGQRKDKELASLHRKLDKVKDQLAAAQEDQNAYAN